MGQEMTPAKKKLLLKRHGPCPVGYTTADLELSLDIIYGLFCGVYTARELQQLVVSDPFDRSETPRSIRLIELAAWLEALVH